MKSRKVRAAWMGGLAVCIGAGCATTRVRTEHDPNASFARYRTFALSQGQVINDGRVDKRDTLVRDRIDTALQQELSSKGLEPTKINPDLIVTYTAGAHTVHKLTPTYAEYSLGGMPPPFLTEYRQGTLVIELIDANTNKIVWRSIARSESGNPREPKTIEKAVDKALQKLPAQLSG